MNSEHTEVTLKLTSNLDSCVIINNSGGMKRGDEACKIALTKTEHTLGGELENLHLQNEYQSQVKAKNIIEFNESEMEAKAVTIPNDINCHQQSDFESSNIGENDAEGNIEKIVESEVINPEPKCLFEDRYNVLEEIGKGRYGVVRKIIDKSTGIHLAAKFVRTIKTKDRQQVLEEINVMNKLRHPKLLRLIAAFESPRETIMVTEYISGGELFERVVADDFTLTEKDSILFVRQICEGVAYMHDEKIVHMDLKPENIMCQMRTSHRIKLIDFGLAQTLKPNTPVRVLFGTPEFISPEIIGFEPIGTESDMWSIGVICYVLLSGLSPFMGDNDAETFANITRADYDFDDKAFDAISQEAMDFISSLLIKRKELRMSAKDCLNHPWLAQCAENMSRVVLSTDKLKKFIVRRKWQKTGNAIRALGRMATLSANSRKNISSASPPNSDIFCEESVPEEIKNIYLLPEESSTLVATSLNNLEADENSGLEAPTRPEISESTIGDFTMDRSFESIDYEKCMIDGTEFTDDSTEESETTLDSCTQLKTASNDMIIENEDMTEIDLTAIRNIQTFNMDPENPTPSTETLINTPSYQLNYKNSVDFRPIHEQVCETTQRQGNSKNSHHELDEQTIKVEEILNPLRPNSTDFHERNDLFDEITDSQFKSDTLNTDEKPEEREPTRVTTRTASLGRIVSTGSVTRTAKMFEQESIASQSRTPVNRIFLPTADARPQNERIRKAFAFWQN